MITTVLFDLDGTLLPMDQIAYVKHYLRVLSDHMSQFGYDSDLLVKGIWDGTMAMYNNDGSKQNSEIYWDILHAAFGDRVYTDQPIFDSFYRNEFQEVQVSCGFNPNSAGLIQEIREMGLNIVLATNPVFPAEATRSRVRWAGMQPEDFQLITAYENSRFCKPQLAYYQDILDTLQLRAEECIMVGNDVDEDMIARKLGMRVFLLTECLINRSNSDINQFPNGSFDDLISYLHEIRS